MFLGLPEGVSVHIPGHPGDGGPAYVCSGHTAGGAWFCVQVAAQCTQTSRSVCTGWGQRVDCKVSG